MRVYTVQIAPEISGTVVALNVRDDQFVHKGDLLFRIDPRTYQNLVTEAEGQLAQSAAKASYLDADARRMARLTNLAVSDQVKEDALGNARTRERKLQAPSSNIQRSSNNQISNALANVDWSLVVGASLVLGAWNLELKI